MDRHLSVLMKLDQVVRELRAKASPRNVEGMARYGISTKGTLGISVNDLRAIAKRIGKDHDLAHGLWSSGIHEARILAALVDDPSKVTEAQMESWAAEFDSWDVVDQLCSNLFVKTKFARSKASEWCGRDEEFVKRAGFSLIVALTVHDKAAPDVDFQRFLTLIERESTDERNFVKKAVNWSLRQIGKRNPSLNRKAIKVAERISRLDSKSARWIASDALRELKGDKVRQRFSRRAVTKTTRLKALKL